MTAWMRCGFEACFYVFLVLLFLTLGGDYSGHFILRSWFAAFLVIFYLLLTGGRFGLNFRQNPVLVCLTLFLCFEVVRALWGFWSLRNPASGLPEPLSRQYIGALLTWGFYSAFLIIPFSFFNHRALIKRFAGVAAGCGFFMAMNVLPTLFHKRIIDLQSGRIGHLLENGERVFFYPFFYFREWVSKYLLGTYAYVNIVGDLFVLSFFAAWGAGFYALQKCRKLRKEKKAGIILMAEGKEIGQETGMVFLYFILAFASLCAILLLFSRGTIVCFIAGLAVFQIALSVKFRSQRTVSRLVLGGIIFSAGVLGSINLKAVGKELQTVGPALDVSKPSSLSTNRDGTSRAWGVFKDYPLWGAGTDGYYLLANRYASAASGLIPSASQATFDAMCHYIQVLAEEGVGAFLYFLFLAAYLFQMVRGLHKTQSRFRFTLGLAFFCAVLAILFHASVKPVMQRFPMAMLAYIFMGVSLAIFHPDFQHEST